MKEEKIAPQLRTIDQISGALEELYHKQREGKIDPKTADAMNTTVKGIMKLHIETPMKLLDSVIKAHTKKVEIPQRVLEAMPIKIT